MASDTSKGHQSKHAPRYAVPNTNIIAVEHPFLVKNVERAIDILGGPATVADAIRTNKSLGVSFDPEHPTSRSVMSLPNAANNVLLRITVPKRIGKRKRGSSEPFNLLDSPHPVMRDAAYLLRSVKDNKAKTAIEAVGSIQRSHIWRCMPDFDYSTRSSNFLSEIKSKILPQQYPLLQQWQLFSANDFQDTDVVPPPVLSSVLLPEPYNYYQQDFPRPEDEDQPDDQRTPKHPPGVISCNGTDPFPASLPTNWPKLGQQTPAVRDLVPLMRNLFAQRPMWTRHALVNQSPHGRLTQVGIAAVGYVAFMIRSGPWSTSFCAFGVDPRMDPRCRIYQTMIISTVRRMKRRDRVASLLAASDELSHPIFNPRSHIFTGQGSAHHLGHTFQLCDLEDPQLKSLVDVDAMRLLKECDTEGFGWYDNGTLTKVRLILKAKIHALQSGEGNIDAVFERLLEFPDHYDPSDKTWNQTGGRDPGYMPADASAREKDMATSYRQGCTNQGRTKFRIVREGFGSDSDSEVSDSVVGEEQQAGPIEGNLSQL
jgi:general transcription factor 3C polypeptide 5 (transcription factor C subunit 1)